MEDIDPLNRYRPTALPFVDPVEKLKQQAKKSNDPGVLKVNEDQPHPAPSKLDGEEEATAYAEEQDMKQREITKYFIDNDPTDERLFHVQLPTALPILTSTAQQQPRKKPPKNPNLPTLDVFEPTVNQIPPGFLGQIYVYKSGKAKIKLGETLFDIVPGAECGFLQETAYLSADQELCCMLGEVSDRLSFVPDIDSLLQNQLDLNTE